MGCEEYREDFSWLENKLTRVRQVDVIPGFVAFFVAPMPQQDESLKGLDTRDTRSTKRRAELNSTAYR